MRLQNTGNEQQERAKAVAKLRAFYSWKDPSKVGDVEQLCDVYAGNYPGMFALLGEHYPDSMGWARARDATVDYLVSSGSKDPEGEADKVLQEWHAQNPPKSLDSCSVAAGQFFDYYGAMDKKFKTDVFGCRLALAMLYSKDDPRMADSLLAECGAELFSKQYKGKCNKYLQEKREWYHLQKLRTRRWARDYYMKHNPTKARDVDALIESPVYKGHDGWKELQLLLLQKYDPQEYVDLCTWSSAAPDINKEEALQEFWRVRDNVKIAQVPVILKAFNNYSELCEQLCMNYEAHREGQSGFIDKWKAAEPRLWPPWRMKDYPKEYDPSEDSRNGAPRLEGLKVPSKPTPVSSGFPSLAPFPLSAADRKELEKEIKRAQQETAADLAERHKEERDVIEDQEKEPREEIKKEEEVALPPLTAAYKELEKCLAEWKKKRAAEEEEARKKRAAETEKLCKETEKEEHAARDERTVEESKAREKIVEEASASLAESEKRQREREEKEGGEKAKLLGDESTRRSVLGKEENEVFDCIRQFCIAQVEAEKESSSLYVEKQEMWDAIHGFATRQKEEREGLEGEEESARAEISPSMLEEHASLIAWATSAAEDNAGAIAEVVSGEEELRDDLHKSEDAARVEVQALISSTLDFMAKGRSAVAEEEKEPRRGIADDEAQSFDAIASWVADQLRRISDERSQLAATESPERGEIGSAEQRARSELCTGIEDLLRKIRSEQSALVAAEVAPRRRVEGDQESAWRSFTGAVLSFLRARAAEQEELRRSEASARWKLSLDADNFFERFHGSITRFFEGLEAPRNAAREAESSGREALWEEEAAAFQALVSSKRSQDISNMSSMWTQLRQFDRKAAGVREAASNRQKVMASLESRLLLPTAWRPAAPDLRPSAALLGPSVGPLGPSPASSAASLINPTNTAHSPAASSPVGHSQRNTSAPPPNKPSLLRVGGPSTPAPGSPPSASPTTPQPPTRSLGTRAGSAHAAALSALGPPKTSPPRFRGLGLRLNRSLPPTQRVELPSPRVRTDIKSPPGARIEL